MVSKVNLAFIYFDTSKCVWFLIKLNIAQFFRKQPQNSIMNFGHIFRYTFNANFVGYGEIKWKGVFICFLIEAMAKSLYHKYPSDI